MKRAVMIPCKNEAASISTLVNHALRHVDVVFVADDGSTDDTVTVAQRAGAVVEPVPPGRRGLVGVYTYGLQHTLNAVGTDAFIVEMDAGGSHDPAELPRFWRALEKGVDVAAGCRFGMHDSTYRGHWQRWALSKGGTWMVNARHGTAFQDATSGFIGYRGSALEKLLSTPWHSTGHYYQTEMRLRAVELGLRLEEVPISYQNSSSSLNWRSIREALTMVLSS